MSSTKMKFLNKLLYPIFLLILCFPICISTDSDLPWYDSCGSYFNCGYILHVGFPFWGVDRPKNCGYPDLELSCEDDETTVIYSKGMKYHVLDISQNTRILTIAREDFLQGICMQQFINTTLDSTVFDYGPDSRNFTVLYGCPSPSTYGYGDPTSFPGQFNCKISGTNYSIGYAEEGANGPMGCYASIVVPVLELSAQQIGNWSVSQIIGKGFEAKYKLKDEELFTKCTESGGRCGFEDSQNTTCCLCSDGSVRYTSCNNLTSSAIAGRQHRITKSKIFIIIASVSGIGIGICMIIVLIVFQRIKSLKKDKDIEALLKKHGSVGPKRYTYRDLKRITNSFKIKLGEGGYGIVYEGKLNSGQQVAVKILKNSSKGDMDMVEFINEVASIGNTNHKNIVKLLGFCYECKKRALVYEYMPCGSLEKFTHGGSHKNTQLSWDSYFDIAIGIARGLEYLHQGCNMRILHFDIKPQNILLDETYCPKISDFGLAKICIQKDSIISMSEARGTVGYIAPEVFFKSYGGVSHKSDVYSYGMLVLEMIGCRKKDDPKVECSSEQYFPHWIYKELEEVQELNQLKITNDEEEATLRRKMVVVSLWCIQSNPLSRPRMTKVVEMLEGTLESLQIPLMSSLTSPMALQQHSTATATLSIGGLFHE
ncbi:unnamed protein product [Amaranthus hypochondriacus]